MSLLNATPIPIIHRKKKKKKKSCINNNSVGTSAIWLVTKETRLPLSHYRPAKT